MNPHELSHDHLAALVELADGLRRAQRAYLADRTEANGRAVATAAAFYDALRRDLDATVFDALYPNKKEKL